MSKFTARIISKIGLFLVAIGFFMPFTQKMNVFGILNDLSKVSSWLGIDMGSYKFLIYLIFISSVIGVFIGVIILCLLFANKSISLIFDWCPVLIANVSFIILLIRLKNLANEAMDFFGGRSSDLGGIIGDNLQIGAYFIIFGLITSVVFVIVATFMKSSELNSKHLLDIAVWTFTIGMLLLCTVRDNNLLKIFVFSGLVLFILIAGIYEGLKEVNKGEKI